MGDEASPEEEEPPQQRAELHAVKLGLQHDHGNEDRQHISILAHCHGLGWTGH